ncbi:redox-sensing transcriptional repressor Rex [Kiritimatiellota bacterium B12222]|nr:redox-sensing transcriptional repressor Rex [Kiritimatiellota bacterium B12222]
MQSTDQIPHPVIRRLPKYLVHVQELREDGVEWASSQDIADALGLTSSTVRQDLSHMDLRGISKKGYETSQLEAVLRQVLGADIMHHVVIIGAGHLGRALAEHGAFARRGFDIGALFDQDESLIGKSYGAVQVMSMDELATQADKMQIDIGIIAVPSAAAQEVAEQLVAVGVKAILNLAYKHVKVPAHVTVVDARIMESLQELAYALGKKSDLEK